MRFIKMLVQYVSDMHLEMRKPKHARLFATCLITHTPLDVKTLILAGDIGHVSHIREFLRQLGSRYEHVIHVCGNHEFYVKRAVYDVRTEIRRLTEEFPFFRSLQQELLTATEIPALGDKRILGCTLWSPLEAKTMNAMNDVRRIHQSPGILASLKDFQAWHEDDKKWLEQNVREGDVVITHHLPSWDLISPAHGLEYASGYAAHMDHLMTERKPMVWIFGHSHEACNKNFCGVRCVSNPAGYVNEMTGFNKCALIEI